MVDAQNNIRDYAQTFQYDIRPAASILNVFSRLNYHAHYAIAEFVDNSTQSFWLHEKELERSEPNYQMTVTVDYDADAKTLQIYDNAYGMELERFLDAITLDAKNPDQVNSRNEFGMGLKTAASWFGNVWQVSSTALGSGKRYTAIVDIPRLKETGANNVNIKVEPAQPEDHGTTIFISQVTKGMGGRTIGKIRSLLSSMYRRDLESGKISISIQDQKLAFERYPILQFRNQKWVKPLDFTVEFEGKQYRTKGFVGIMSPGSFKKSGFALFRRNRVIIGGEDRNYKPTEIFGQVQSEISLSLFGELDMDDYPVNQAKDGFIWDDGLEDELILTLKANIFDFIEIAKLTKKARAQEERFSEEASRRVQNEVSEAFKKAFQKGNHESSSSENDIVNKFKEAQRLAELSMPDTLIGGSRLYEIPISDITRRVIEVSWSIANNSNWFDVIDMGVKFSVIINVNHPFFKPYSNDEGFQIVLEKFVIAFIVAETQARSVSSKDGYILASAIRGKMNQILSDLGEMA